MRRDRGRVRGDGRDAPRRRRELGAPVGAVLEGGYNLEALAGGVVATMRALDW